MVLLVPTLKGWFLCVSLFECLLFAYWIFWTRIPDQPRHHGISSSNDPFLVGPGSSGLDDVLCVGDTNCSKARRAKVRSMSDEGSGQGQGSAVMFAGQVQFDLQISGAIAFVRASSHDQALASTLIRHGEKGSGSCGPRR